jgi:signal transduction histidine kinase/CheY-like chemotaxis protein
MCAAGVTEALGACGPAPRHPPTGFLPSHADLGYRGRRVPLGSGERMIGALPLAAALALAASASAPRLEGPAWLEDPLGTLGPREVAALPQGRLRPLRGPASAGFGRSPRWIRAELWNPGGAPAEVLLAFEFPVVERLDLFLADGRGGWDHLAGGLALPPAERAVSFEGATHVRRLVLGPGERRMALLRVTTPGAGFLGLGLYDAPAFDRRRLIVGLSATGVGGLLVLLALNARFALRRRRREDLAAWLFLALQTVHVAVASGLVSAAAEVPPGPLASLKAVAAGVSTWAGLLFLEDFLGTASRHPALVRALRLGGVAALAAAALVPVAAVAGNVAVSVAGLWALAAAGAATAEALWAGHRPARLFLPGLLLFSASSGWYTLSLLALAPPSPAVTLVEILGTVVTGAFITLAVARQAEWEEGARQEHLEGLVAERTAGLRSALAALQAEEVERRGAEEELRRAQKLEAVGRLAAGVAHDFNNLLSAVSTNVELVLEDLPADHAGREPLEEAIGAVRRASGLTRQLLAFTSRQVAAPRPTSLDELAQGMARLLGRMVGEDARLDLDLHGGLPLVMADQGQLEQVLLNLVLNARDAVGAGGRIELHTGVVDRAMEGRWVRIRVRDDGVGMDARTRSRIFEPFFTTKPAGRGTGLGLATVYGIVQQHQGTIQVQSEPGKGSTFEILLPALPSQTPVPAPAAPAPAVPGGTETVLVVEDTGPVRRAARSALRRLGYEVLTAGGGQEALALVERHAGPVHLLLTDVRMPGMSGPEVAQRIRGARPGIRVLYMTGYGGDALAGLPVDPGDILEKPFTLEGLGRRVRLALGARPA